MTDDPKGEGSISDEFRSLGENLVKTLRAVWDSPERKKLQQEIEDGLAEVAALLKTEASNISASPTGQQLKSEFEDLRQRVRSGEAEAKAREELLKALKIVNAELEKAVSRWGDADASQGENQPPTS
jgi:uncharacterized membrane protein YccC